MEIEDRVKWIMGRQSRRLRLVAQWLCLVFLTGCIQIHRTVELNKDGSGKLTEIIRFEDQLIQMAKASGKLEALTGFLSEESLKKRMSLYGKVNLLEHEIRKSGDIVRECRTVFAFDSIDELTIPAFPHPAENWAQQNVRFKLEPPRREKHGEAPFFVMPLEIEFSSSTKLSEAAKPKSLMDEEKLRKFLPAFRMLLKGFHITLKMKLFGPVKGPYSGKLECRDFVLYDLEAERDLQDDDTLMNILEWNQYPKKGVAADGTIGKAIYCEKRKFCMGRIMTDRVHVSIPIEIPIAQREPINPLREKAKNPKDEDKGNKK